MPFKIILVGQTVVHFRGLLCIIIDFLCVNYTETVLIHCYTSKKGGKKTVSCIFGCTVPLSKYLAKQVSVARGSFT